MAYSGKWFPKNPSKYTGNVQNIVYRSLWERKFFVWCDENPDVIEWNSEEIIIPYKSPLDESYHRYYPDCFLTTKGTDGTLRKQLVEIKPLKEVHEPVRPKGKRTSKKYIREVSTYLVNQAKWNAAREICKKKGWNFVILTEKQLFPKHPK